MHLGFPSSPLVPIVEKFRPRYAPPRLNLMANAFPSPWLHHNIFTPLPVKSSLHAREPVRSDFTNATGPSYTKRPLNTYIVMLMAATVKKIRMLQLKVVS